MQRIRTCSQLEEAVERTGILPFFKNRVAGWSLAESIDPAVWFTSEEGPWEWKGQLAAGRRCVYGKFIGGKGRERKRYSENSQLLRRYHSDASSQRRRADDSVDERFGTRH